MFEKEAEEWVLELNEKDPYAFPYGGEELRQAFKEGAEYGYNKKCEETFEIALTQIKHDRAVVIEENERLHAKIAELEKELDKTLEEWKKCFLACSSPFCSKQFPTVESSGVLGNMEKKENLKRGTK